jgi:hypothetical protein
VRLRHLPPRFVAVLFPQVGASDHLPTSGGRLLPRRAAAIFARLSGLASVGRPGVKRLRCAGGFSLTAWGGPEGAAVSVKASDDPICSMPGVYPVSDGTGLMASEGHLHFKIFLLAVRESDKSIIVLAGYEWGVEWDGRFARFPGWAWEPTSSMWYVRELILPDERELLQLPASRLYRIGTHDFNPNSATAFENMVTSTDGTNGEKYSDEMDVEEADDLNATLWGHANT